MISIGIVLSAVATVSALGALLYQVKDHVKGSGSTMGGQMTAGASWVLVAVLGGAGVAMIFKWYWGIGAFVFIFALSYGIRTIVERVLIRLCLGRK